MSMPATTTLATGKTSRGHETFWMSGALTSRLMAALEHATEKKVHGTSADVGEQGVGHVAGVDLGHPRKKSRLKMTIRASGVSERPGEAEERLLVAGPELALGQRAHHLPHPPEVGHGPERPDAALEAEVRRGAGDGQRGAALTRCRQLCSSHARSSPTGPTRNATCTLCADPTAPGARDSVACAAGRAGARGARTRDDTAAGGGRRGGAQRGRPADHAAVIAAVRDELDRVLDPYLRPLGRYTVVGYPRARNIGEYLMWLGTAEHLRRRGIRPVYVCDRTGYARHELAARLRGAGTVLLAGGGNLGDLWPHEQRFREQVLEDFPDTRIVQLPQSMHFARTRTWSGPRRCSPPTPTSPCCSATRSASRRPRTPSGRGRC